MSHLYKNSFIPVSGTNEKSRVLWHRIYLHCTVSHITQKLPQGVLVIYMRGCEKQGSSNFSVSRKGPECVTFSGKKLGVTHPSTLRLSVYDNTGKDRYQRTSISAKYQYRHVLTRGQPMVFKQLFG